MLKFAALGVASVALERRQLTTAWASDLPSGDQGIDGLAAFEGTLVDLGSDWLSVQLGPNDIRKVQATPKSSFWKGEDTSLANFTQGDDVLVRTLYGSIDRAWDNLDRLKGVVIGQTAQGYEIEVHDRFSSLSEAEIVVGGYTIITDDITGAGAPTEPLPNGATLDAIGLSLGGGELVASLVGYTLPGEAGTSSPTRGPDSVVYDPLTDSSAYTYHGCITWFSCPTGAGRCGKCDTSKDHQCAWPHWDTCGSCTGTCCDCSQGCLGQVRFSDCGHNMGVHSRCSGVGISENAVDCGPCQKCNDCSPCACDTRCHQCDITHDTAIVDLTKPSYSLFFNPDNIGKFPGHVTVVV